MSDQNTPAVDDQPAPQRRLSSARIAQIVIASIGALVLLVSGVFAFVSWPRSAEAGPAADLPGSALPWVDGEYVSEGEPMWMAMNQALRAKDRDAFLSWATDEAVAQLGRWWDNTTAIGWDTAAISPMSEPDENNTQSVMLGVQFGFAAHPERGSGDADADLALIQGFEYTVTVEPESPDAPSGVDKYYNEDGTEKEPETAPTRKITSIAPANEPNPWDEGEIHVAKRDNVVLFGMSDEAALVDQTADLAETSAVTALDTLRSMGANLPHDGFVSAVTADAGRFQRWQYGTGTPWEMDVAGYARPTLRPPMPERWLDPSIATGFDTSGTLVVMGPLSSDSRESTFVHEFAHALHNTGAPGGFSQPPVAVMEGWARYFEWAAGVEEPLYADPRVSGPIAEKGADAFGDDALRSKEAWKAYEAAGSYYAFAAERGHTPWQIALETRNMLGGLVGYAQKHDDVSIAAWQEWVASR